LIVICVSCDADAKQSLGADASICQVVIAMLVVFHCGTDIVLVEHEAFPQQEYCSLPVEKKMNGRTHAFLFFLDY